MDLTLDLSTSLQVELFQCSHKRDQTPRPENQTRIRPIFYEKSDLYQTFLAPKSDLRATSLARVGPTAAAAEAVVATPVKPVIYLMKNQFHRENLQISGVPD